MRCFDEAFVPRLFMLLNLIRCEVLNNHVDHFMKDKLLFIPFVIFKKCNIPFKWKTLIIYYEIFMLGKRGVTLFMIDEL